MRSGYQIPTSLPAKRVRLHARTQETFSRTCRRVDRLLLRARKTHEGNDHPVKGPPRHRGTIPEDVSDVQRRCHPPSTLDEGESPAPQDENRADRAQQKQPTPFAGSSTRHGIGSQNERSSSFSLRPRIHARCDSRETLRPARTGSEAQFSPLHTSGTAIALCYRPNGKISSVRSRL